MDKQQIIDRFSFNIPDGLKRMKNWLVWKYIHKKDEKKPTKMPFYVSGKVRKGIQGDEKDLESLENFQKAIETFENESYSGVGFAMIAGQNLTALDLDNCLDSNSQFLPEKKHLEKLIVGTYSEISPSGKGVRAFYSGNGVHGKKDGVEVFSTSQFVTVTGNAIGQNPIIEMPESVKIKLQNMLGEKTGNRSEKISTSKKNPIYKWIKENWKIKCETKDGRVGIECPFESDHTTASGDLDCVFFFPNTHGFSEWNIHCLHSHCGDKPRHEFLNKMGWVDDFSEFDENKILIKQGELPKIIGKCQHFISLKGDLYERAGQLVRIIESDKKKMKISREFGQLIIMPVGAIWLRLYLSNILEFYKYNSKGKPVKIDCPKDISETIISNSGDWDINELSTISSNHAVLESGEIISKKGYDEVTGIFFNTRNDFQNVEIDEAKGMIESIIDEYPFSSSLDKAVCISAFFTAIVRPLIDTAPLIAFDSPMPGSGKSLICDVIAIVATGKTPVTLTIPNKDEREMDKAIDSVMLSGDQIALIDNIEYQLISSKLCSCITQSFVNVRILGKSGLIPCKSKTFWLVNGNNIEIANDIARRTLKCRIIPTTENPEEREFKKNIKEYAFLNRDKIINSILSIISISLKNNTEKIDRLGSFEQWSAFVRYPIKKHWGIDIVESKRQIKSEDPQKAKLIELMECWESCLPNGGTVKDAMKSKDFEMIECLSDFKDRHGDISPKIIGNYIKKSRDKEINGKSFKKTGDYKHNAVWMISSVEFG
jgi:putative DNA primase/helicase